MEKDTLRMKKHITYEKIHITYLLYHDALL